MEANIRVVCFFEDVAQERLIGTLIDRVAEEIGIRRQRLQREVRVAEPGFRVHEQLKTFAKQGTHELSGPDVVLVVAIDCNCMGRATRQKQLEKSMGVKRRNGRKGKPPDGIVAGHHIVFCLPDPHIERWYIADQHAFNEAIGPRTAPQMPAYKCEQDYYKSILREALTKADSRPLLGGAEYGELIAQKINLQWLSGADAAFKSFYDELRGALKLVSSGST